MQFPSEAEEVARELCTRLLELVSYQQVGTSSARLLSTPVRWLPGQMQALEDCPGIEEELEIWQQEIFQSAFQKVSDVACLQVML